MSFNESKEHIPSQATNDLKNLIPCNERAIIIPPYPFSHRLLPSLPRVAMEVDGNALVTDCVVICCCCECLILQIVVFLLLDLPCKVAKKTREYAKKKLRRHKRKRRRGVEGSSSSGGLEGLYCASEGEVFGSFGLIQLQVEVDGSPFSGGLMCMEEVEKVLEELSLEGEFAFGSFWGRDCTGRCNTFVHSHLSEVVAGPSNSHSNS